MEPVATEEQQPDACKFFRRWRDKYVATISQPGTNDTLASRICFFSLRTHTESYPDCPISSCLEASFMALWTRPKGIQS